MQPDLLPSTCALLCHLYTVASVCPVPVVDLPCLNGHILLSLVAFTCLLAGDYQEGL